MSIFIDRRLNDRNKSAVHRDRFIRRYQKQLRGVVDGLVVNRSITDMMKGASIRIPVRDLTEPRWRFGQGGDQEIVHSGNHSFRAGDRIERPQGGGGGGQGPGEGAGEGGQGQDDFAFELSRDEFERLFFDDLALPNMTRKVLGQSKDKKIVRRFITKDGTPHSLHVARSLKAALMRRIATGAQRARRDAASILHAATAQAGRVSGAAASPVLALDAPMLTPAQAPCAEAKPRTRVPFLDEVDLRYRYRSEEPQPVSQAVMFCLMDVSASMTEAKKDLAKRFFTLLYIFLARKYQQVQVVFIRHTEEAEEVEEQEFFHGTASGGTVVLSALEMMRDTVEKRFPPSAWNIYAAQASDGDAFGADPEKSRGYLMQHLLPASRYFAYIEIPDTALQTSSALWHAYSRVPARNFAMKRVLERGEIYPVFRELFRKEGVTAE